MHILEIYRLVDSLNYEHANIRYTEIENNTAISAQSAGRAFFGHKKQQKIQRQSNGQKTVTMPGIQLQQQGQFHFTNGLELLSKNILEIKNKFL
jgi:hypothetical protein